MFNAFPRGYVYETLCIPTILLCGHGSYHSLYLIYAGAGPQQIHEALLAISESCDSDHLQSSRTMLAQVFAGTSISVAWAGAGSF